MNSENILAPRVALLIDGSNLQYAAKKLGFDIDFKRLLDLWPKTVSGSVVPIGASAFGDLFFQRPLGNVEKLDVLAGGVHYAAASFDEF